MMSFAAVSNIQYRLKEEEGGTLITLKHSALALFPEGYRAEPTSGWKNIFERVRQRVETRAMTVAAGLLQELEQESQATRRVLERVPDSRLAWRPHEKSWTLGQLAMHVATVPGSVAEFVSQPSPVQVPPFADPPAPKSTSELGRLYEESLDKARQILSAMDDATATATWRMHGRRARADGDASRRLPADGDAQPLVSPPRAAVGVPAVSRRAAAVDLRPERRREPLRLTTIRAAVWVAAMPSSKRRRSWV